MFVDLSPPVSGLVSTLCATMLYGVNVVVFFTCVYVLVQRRLRGGYLPWFLFGGAVTQFIVSTVHIGNAWRRLFEAFIWNAQIPGASISYWVADPSRSTEIISNSVVIISSCLVDAALVWRLYMIWNKNIYVCILPIVMLVTYAITYFIGIGKLVHLADRDLSVVSQWLVAGLTFSLVTNASITCLIAGRVWSMSRRHCISPVTTRCMTVMWTILESGAVYGLTTVFLVVFTAMRSQVGGFISNLFVQICGIIPSLIIVRVGPGLMSDRLQTNNLPVRFDLPEVQRSCDSEVKWSSFTGHVEVICRK